MGHNGTIDLTPNQHRLVLVLLAQYLPRTDAWAYGSRVKWTARPQSDLDLVVFSGPEARHQVSGLREALEESSLPFHVSVLVWDDLPESFQKEIDDQHVAIAEHSTTLHSATTVCFGDCAILVRDSVDPSHVPADTPYIGLTHIPSNQLAVTSHGTACDVTSAKTRFQRGDILFGKLAPHSRKVALARYSGICSTDIWVVRGRPGVDQEYLFYQMAARDFVDHANSGSEGTIMPRASWDHVERYEMVLPCLAEQRRVARLLGVIDDKVHVSRRIVGTMERMVQAQYRAIVDRFKHSTDKPSSGWRLVRLGDVMAINPRRPLRRGTEAPYLSMANMPTAGHSPVSIAQRPYGHGARFTNGDTLVARITPCLENGKTAYVDFLPHDAIGWGSTEYVVLRPTQALPNELAYCVARSPSFRDFAVANMTGTSGRQRVSAGVLSEYQFVLPPRHVLSDFGDRVRLCMSRSRSAVLDSQRLTTMRDVLLPTVV